MNYIVLLFILNSKNVMHNIIICNLKRGTVELYKFFEIEKIIIYIFQVSGSFNTRGEGGKKFANLWNARTQ